MSKRTIKQAGLIEEGNETEVDAPSVNQLDNDMMNTYAIQQCNLEQPHYDKCKNNIIVDVNKKRHDKKFLCLNGRPKYFRRTLTDFFIDNDLIKDSSYSFRDKDITLTYDNKFNDYYYDDDQVSMKKWKTMKKYKTMKKWKQTITMIPIMIIILMI